MQKRILYCASTLSHIRNFHLPYLQEFRRRGYEVWVAADAAGNVPYADHTVALPFAKNFFSFENIKAIFLARRLMKRQKFDVVSTHTALASAVIRAAVLLLRKKPLVFCTVHGYLFHETDGMKKWVYLLPEKICARVTDVLMVMNREDYEIAKRHRLYQNRLACIGGMGIEREKFFAAAPDEKNAVRARMGFAPDDFLFVYAAEFSARKNQICLIRAFAAACGRCPDMKLLLAGEGKLLKECKMFVREQRLEERILFPGYVTDMRSLYSACDVCVSSSRIEGLPFNIMEAMACGLPVVASDIKGHRELVDDGRTGLLYREGNSDALAEKMEYLYHHRDFGPLAGEKIRERLRPYELRQAFGQIMGIYRDAGC